MCTRSSVAPQVPSHTVRGNRGLHLLHILSSLFQGNREKSVFNPLSIAKRFEIYCHFNLSKICEGDVFTFTPFGPGMGGTVARTTQLVATSMRAQAQPSAARSGFVTAGDPEQHGFALCSPLTVEPFIPHQSRASSGAGSLRLRRGSCSSSGKVSALKHPRCSRSHWSELVTAATNPDNFYCPQSSCLSLALTTACFYPFNLILNF